MGEFSSAVERQRILLEAEKWAKQIVQIQCHALTSLYYDTAETKAEIEKNGPVVDTVYNSGLIIRTRNNKEVCRFGIERTGDDLIDWYFVTEQPMHSRKVVLISSTFIFLLVVVFLPR